MTRLTARQLLLLSSLMVFAVLNYAIYAKERILAEGDPILLELAPADPRSLMQGDYMNLRFAIEREVPALANDQRKVKLVIAPRADGVARFVRLHAGERLAPEEKLLKATIRYQRATIRPDSFFFQEGHAGHYNLARYGIFTFAPSGEYLLTGLADEQRRPILPPTPDQASPKTMP